MGCLEYCRRRPSTLLTLCPAFRQGGVKTQSRTTQGLEGTREATVKAPRHCCQRSQRFSGHTANEAIINILTHGYCVMRQAHSMFPGAPTLPWEPS